MKPMVKGADLKPGDLVIEKSSLGVINQIRYVLSVYSSQYEFIRYEFVPDRFKKINHCWADIDDFSFLWIVNHNDE